MILSSISFVNQWCGKLGVDFIKFHRGINCRTLADFKFMIKCHIKLLITDSLYLVLFFLFRLRCYILHMHIIDRDDIGMVFFQDLRVSQFDSKLYLLFV